MNKSGINIEWDATQIFLGRADRSSFTLCDDKQRIRLARLPLPITLFPLYPFPVPDCHVLPMATQDGAILQQLLPEMCGLMFMGLQGHKRSNWLPLNYTSQFILR